MGVVQRYFRRVVDGREGAVVGYHPSYEERRDMVECDKEGRKMEVVEKEARLPDDIVEQMADAIPSLGEGDFNKTDGKPKIESLCRALGIDLTGMGPRNLPITKELRDKALALAESRKTDGGSPK